MTLDQVRHIPLKPLRPSPQSHEDQVRSAEELKKAYADFVGKTFFGQLMKSMRSTVGEPAYFSGGRTEEAFRTQLDQQMADAMSDASSERLAEPMFRRDFPRQAALLDAAAKEKRRAGLADLEGLRRR